MPRLTCHARSRPTHQVSAAVSSFVTLEARLAAARTDPCVIESWQLPELTYRVAGVAR